MRYLIPLVLALFTTTAVNASEITGAGASFPYPLYSKWSIDYEKQTGSKVNYQSIGSGAGINLVKQGIVSFGATDIPLNDKELNDNNLTQFATVKGAVVPIVNLSEDVNLTGEIVAMIYSGEITKWNDERIKKVNTKINLPDTNIVVVHRSESSGTTFIWTSFLSKSSKTWNDLYGASATPDWPVGVGAKGNEGIAGTVAQLPNSIGYIEYAFAKNTNKKIVKLNNKAPNMNTFISNEWPIVAPTYILVPKNSQNRGDVLKFFDWTKKNGKQSAIDLYYIPIQ